MYQFFILSYNCDIRLIIPERYFMAQKNDSFDAGDVNLANLAKAFSHPARISILRTLAEKNMCICGEVVEVLPLAQSTVSQHLKELKKERAAATRLLMTELRK